MFVYFCVLLVYNILSPYTIFLVSLVKRYVVNVSFPVPFPVGWLCFKVVLALTRFLRLHQKLVLHLCGKIEDSVFLSGSTICSFNKVCMVAGYSTLQLIRCSVSMEIGCVWGNSIWQGRSFAKSTMCTHLSIQENNISCCTK